jgi:hypothetical protein
MRRWLFVGVVGSVMLACAAGCSQRERVPRTGSVDAGRDGSAPDAALPDAPIGAVDAPPACSATVTGTVRFPNGVQPVPSAVVYTTAGEVPAPRTGECNQCIASGAALTHTETAVDGTFTLSLSRGSRLVIEKGVFVRTLDVEVTECGATIALDDEATRLPRNDGEGRIPRIAIGTGFYDAMQNVVAKIGLGAVDSSGWLVPGSEQFDLYDGTGDGFGSMPTLESLLRDEDRLKTYDIVFINCGSAPEDDFFGGGSILSEPAVRANLRAFVEGGGRLYVTDEAYDYVEQTFPRFIAFEEDGDLTETPEPEDEAELGEDMESVDATVHDDTLRAWLESLGHAVGGTVQITGMIGGWTVIEEVDTTLGKTWVSGNVMWYGSSGFELMSDVRPLTVTFDLGCGRVLYTSYHTDDSFFGTSGTALTAQELILAYLILEIGKCIEDPVLI